MSTITKTPDDWLVGVRYVGWDDVERVRVIGVSFHIRTAAGAIEVAKDSIRRGEKWELPPKIKAVEARRASELGIKSANHRKTLFLQKVKL